MRFAEFRFNDPDMNRLQKAVQSVFANISVDNFASVLVDDTTSGTANSKKVFRHGFDRAPSFWIVLEGNAYVQYGGVTDQEIDVRSTNANEKFKLLIVK